MAYPNLNNMCIFEGRCTKGSFTEEMVNTQNGQMLKIKFSLSVPRTGVSNNQNNGQQQKTNDFVSLVATGQKAEFIKKWFGCGHALKVMTVYREWQTTDQAGNKKYGHNFEVVDATFVCSHAQDAAPQGQWNNANNNNGGGGYQQNNGGGYQNNNNGNYQQNNGGYQQPAPQQNNGGGYQNGNQQPAMNPPQQPQQNDYDMFGNSGAAGGNSEMPF